MRPAGAVSVGRMASSARRHVAVAPHIGKDYDGFSAQ